MSGLFVPASAIAARLAAVFATYGQTVIVTHGGVPTVRKGRVTALNLSVRAIYFAKTETDGWAHPAYQVTFAGEVTALSVGDAVVLPNGIADLTIRGWDHTRLGDGVFKTVVFVARDAPV